MSKEKYVLSDLERKEMNDLINALKNMNVKYTYYPKRNRIEIECDQRIQHYAGFSPIYITICKQGDVEIRLEGRGGFKIFFIKGNGKEYRVPITTYPFMYTLYAVLIIEFHHVLDPPKISDDQKTLISFLDEEGIKYEVKENEIWIKGSPIYISDSSVVLRQDDGNDLEVQKFSKSISVVYRKGDNVTSTGFIKDVVVTFFHSYLIFAFKRQH